MTLSLFRRERRDRELAEQREPTIVAAERTRRARVEHAPRHGLDPPEQLRRSGGCRRIVAHD
jgi:hypothetical protein